MPTPEEYYRQQQEEAQNALRRSALIVSQPLTQTPDEYANAAKLARTMALPTAVIEPQIKTFQQRMLEKRTEMVLGTAPVLTDWITRDDNYRIAQDDIDGLSWWEKGLPGVVTNSLSRGVRKIPQTAYQWMAMNAAERAADEKRGFGEILADETSVMVRGDRIQPGSPMMPGAPALAAAISRWGTSRLTNLIGVDNAADAVSHQQQAGQAAKDRAAIKMSEPGERFKSEFAKVGAAGDWQSQLQAFASIAGADPAGLLAFLGETAIESVPSIAAASVVGVATRSPTVAAMALGAQSGATEYGMAPVEFFQEHGIDVSTPDGALAALNNADLMRQADERGITRGLIIGIMDGLSGGVAGKTLAQSPIGNLALQSIVQAGMGAGGEAGAQVASGQKLNLGDVIVEGLAEFATAPLEVAGIGGRTMIENRAKAREAASNAEIIADISSQAQSSVLRERMPEKFREYIAAATVDGPVESVYVPAQDFVEYFQSQGIDPFDLTDELEGVSRDDLSAALAGGGDLRIPTATYASALAGSDADPFLMENMRFSPDAMTAREAAEFNEQAADVLEEAWQEAERIRVQEESLRGVEEVIYTDMQSRLRQAGRTTDVANAEATLYPAFYRVMAQRSGMPVEEFLARYPLPQVEGVRPEGIQTKDVTAFNRTLAEARMRKAPVADKRQSILEFISERGGINDPGGELRARDAKVVKRGRGKKSLKLARESGGQGSLLGGGDGGISYSVDDVARAAIEAGFMADNPDVLAYKQALAEGGEVPDIVPALWEAIDAELRGDKQVSADEAAPDADRDEALDQLEEYLASIGASLDDDDDAILAAVRQDDEARRYGQGEPLGDISDDDLLKALESGTADTSSDAFKAWFGNSKVVDDNGNPQIVYHNSHMDIEAFDRMASANRFGLSFNNLGLWFSNRKDKQGGAGMYGPKQYAVYMSMQKPFVIHGHESREMAFAGGSDAAFRKFWKLYDKLTDDGSSPTHRKSGMPIREEQRLALRDPEPMRQWLKDNGYDGLILRNTFGDTPSSESQGQDMFVVLEPEQVKSVDNVGTFDRNDARLLFQSGTGDRRAEMMAAREFFAGMEAGEFRQTVPYTAEPDYHRFQYVTPNGVNVSGTYTLDGGTIDNFSITSEGGPRSVGAKVTREIGRALKAAHPEAKTLMGYRLSGARRNAGGGDEFVSFDLGRFYQDMGNGPRGSIQFPAAGLGNGETIIRLSEKADLSTFLHESGHYFLTVMQDMAGKGEPSAASEFEAIKGWWRENAAAVAKDANKAAGSRGALNQSAAPVDFNAILASAKERTALAKQLAEPGAAVRLKHADGRYALAGPDMSSPGGFRLTRFDGDGPVGHTEHATLEDAVLEGLRAHYTPGSRVFRQDRLDPGEMTGEPIKITEADVIRALDTGTSGDPFKDMLIDVGMQEQWARGFEQYVMEGKAPSAELRSAFERFRAWLISVYRKLTGLNVNINDDLRQVFNRMLATDEEIAQATEDSGGDGMVFATAEEMGLTAEEYSRFLTLRQQAEEEGKARLLKETMEPVKRAQQKWFKEERATVHDEMSQRINREPVYRAIEWMGNRRWLGEDQPEAMPDIRLSKTVLVERYGEGILKTLPRGKQTIYTVDGGLDPDDAAGWFGFESGDQMLQSMERAMPRKEAIEAETDRAMYDRHGDIMRDGSIEEAALLAVHNDKRGQWLAAELKAVADVADAGPTMTAKQSREIARQTIARMRVRDAMAAGRFLAAERKAGKEAAALGAMLAREGVWMGNARRRIATKARAALREDGTVDAVAAQVDQANAATGNYNETVARLLDAKRRQLLNHALYSEARKASEEVAKAERLAASFTKSEKRKKIAGAGRRENAQIDYLAAIDEILDRYDFRKMSGAAEQRRGALNLYIEQMTAAGRENELAIPEAVLAQAQRLPYKTIPVEELRGVVDTLRNLEHTAGRWNKLIDAAKERDFTAAVDDVVGSFEANVKPRPPGRVSSTAEDWRNTGRKFFDLVLNSTTLLREIDGFTDFGAAYANIKAPIDEAMNRLIVRKDQAASDLEALYEVYSKDERRAMSVRKFIDELGYSLSKWEMIAVALNTGNEGNYQRLTDPRVKGHLNDDQVIAVLAKLDARDAKFVQSVWDYVETFRPDIAERERRATGVQPDWVEAKPVEIAGVSLKGGYYPLKYDPRLSSLARDDEMANLAQSMQAGRFGKAQTRNGHLKERGASSGRDIELDISVLHRHTNQVMYDLELSEAVTNSWRILQDSRVRDRFVQSGKQADFDALEAWLKDVAEGEVKSADFVGRASRTLKSNFTAAKLAFNFSTVAMQITGLSQSMVVVGKKDFAVGVMQSFRTEARDEVSRRSPYMKTRQTTFNKDIYDFYNDPKLGPVASRWGDIKKDIIGPAAFWLMTKVQYHLVDIPTWLAGYNKGLRQFGNDEAKAVAFADSIVKRAQSSGLFSDRSAIERGSVSANARQNDVVRLFTTLASYMFAKFNVAYERSATAAQTVREEGISIASAREALSWTIDMAFLFTLEAVVTAAIKGGLPDDDDDDEALAASWMKFLAKETAFSAVGTVPFIRDVASTTQGFASGGGYGGIIADISKPLIEIGQGEFDKGFVKSVITGTGLALGLPATQINRFVDAGWRTANGEEVSPVEYFLGKPRKSDK